MTELELSIDVQTKQSEEFSLVLDGKGPQQPNEVEPIEHSVALQDAPSTHPLDKSQHIDRDNSIPPTIDLQDIPLRKAELLQAARMGKKAERKAHYLADKATIKKELKVWENIALAVWCRGISLEQLRLNQGKIASWVVDTLRAEEDHKDDLTADPHCIPTAKATTSAAELVDSTVAKVEEDELKETPRVISAGFTRNSGLESEFHQISGKARVSDKSAPKSSMFDIYQGQEDGSESPTTNLSTIQPQHRLYNARNSRASKPNDASRRVKIPAAVRGELASRNEIPSSSGHSAHIIPLSKPVSPTQVPVVTSARDEMAGGLNVGRKDILLDRKAARVHNEGMGVQPMSRSSSTSEDRVVLEKPRPTFGVGVRCESGSSYVTEIFDDGSQYKDKGRFSPNSSVHNRHDNERYGSDTEVTCSSATSLNDVEAEDRENQDVKKDEYDTSEVTEFVVDEGHIGQTNHLSRAAFTKASFREDGPTNTYADTCSEHSVEADRYDESLEARCISATGDEANVGEMIDAGNGGVEVDAESEDGSEDGACEDEGNSSASEAGLPEFEDHGGFDRYTVCNLLGMGQLDELRLLRLKEGFLKLLEQC